MGRVGGGSNNNQFTSRGEGRNSTRHRNRHSACAPIQPDGPWPVWTRGIRWVGGIGGIGGWDGGIGQDGMDGVKVPYLTGSLSDRGCGLSCIPLIPHPPSL